MQEEVERRFLSQFEIVNKSVERRFGYFVETEFGTTNRSSHSHR